MSHMLAMLRSVMPGVLGAIPKGGASRHGEEELYLEHLWQDADSPGEALFLFRVDNHGPPSGGGRNTCLAQYLPLSQCTYNKEEPVKRTMSALTLMAAAIVTLSGCFPGGSSYSPQEPAGFFSGVWHGWIAPLSLIVGLFKDGIRIYEPVNTGWWYDFGFYIAVISGFGGISLFRGRKKKGEGTSR